MTELDSKVKVREESMKREITNTDIFEDTFYELSIGIDLMNTMIEEHFAMINAPDDWNDGFCYQAISRKLSAIAKITNHAVDMLAILKDGCANEYVDGKIKYIAKLLDNYGKKVEEQPDKT